MSYLTGVLNKEANDKEAILIWIDMEMTGLDPKEDHVMEIATILTDLDLNIIAEGPEFQIKVSDSKLKSMDKWCQDTHGKSGLTEKCRNSDISLKEAYSETLRFIKAHVPQGTGHVSGNTIGQDMKFIEAYMPKITEYVHYRTLDVSSFKIVFKKWFPGQYMYEKANTHTALSDIKESIGELRHYMGIIK